MCSVTRSKSRRVARHDTSKGDGEKNYFTQLHSTFRKVKVLSVVNHLHRYFLPQCLHSASAPGLCERSRPSARSALARSLVRAASASSAPERRASATRCSAVAAASSVPCAASPACAACISRAARSLDACTPPLLPPARLTKTQAGLRRHAQARGKQRPSERAYVRYIPGDFVGRRQMPAAAAEEQGTGTAAHSGAEQRSARRAPRL